jgi:hypothetical protein
MNYIKHLTGFFDKVTKDKQLNPTHISLYIALFQFWNCNRFKNPISISRDEVMRISKISSKATYHKCLKALHSLGYIKYEPSYNPFKGSHVFLFNFSDDLKPLTKSERNNSSNFEPVTEQATDMSHTATETASVQLGEQVVVPSINNINNTNIPNVKKGLNSNEPKKKIEEENLGFKNESAFEMSSTFADTDKNQTAEHRQKEKGSAEKEKDVVNQVRQIFSQPDEKQPEAITEKPTTIPVLDDVLAYFREQDFPEIEANKFFNYFKSIGWLVGGKTPMADWPAAARNWMLNAPKYSINERTDRTKHFDTSAGKDYSEPL